MAETNEQNRKNDWRKKKWKGIMLSESNIDEYIKDIRMDTKGQYITQGVSFNKDDALQMNLLKQTLLTHGTFSGFIKHLLYSYFANQQEQQKQIHVQQQFILQQNGESKLHDERVLNNGEIKNSEIKKEPIKFTQTDSIGYDEEDNSITVVNDEDVNELDGVASNVNYTNEEELLEGEIEETDNHPERTEEEKQEEERKKRERAKMLSKSNFLASNNQGKKPTN